MERISAWTPLVAPLGQFRYGTVAGGVAPTPLKAEWLNMIQNELANFILAYLPKLDAEDNTQLLKAIEAFGERLGDRFALKATTLAGYGITDSYTKVENDGQLSKKANNAITLAGYGIGDAYTKLAINAFVSDLQVAIDNLAKTKQDKNTALMAATGWRLDSATGLLEQWGSGECGPDSTTQPINFPRPFAEVYNCFGNKITPNADDSDGNAAGARAVSITQYQLFNDTNSYSATIHWRAIGKAPGF
ncbi:phage tail protein [Pseudomonas sp. FSL R10-0765]|uniref:gp53-like domain-containing protein n=1 Tax=Pseudomonas sp. FSL R10-0765 TaxID=2662195 RepID=UPI001295DFFB|nr:phage tail protein [Pseudomonas sp. FSL R10-0765]MQT41409.1 phage tail protein [Pseudomonas sp. FSL R10-0765]